MKLPALLVANVLPREGLDKYRSTNFRPDEHTPLLLLVDSQTGMSSHFQPSYDTDIPSDLRTLLLPFITQFDDMIASASEIFAAALMDHNRALCLGTKTVGKNVAQVVTTITKHAA